MFEVFELSTSEPIAAYLIVIMLYITGGSFPRILQVCVMCSSQYGSQVSYRYVYIRRLEILQRIALT